jgi:16S rRNA (guanine(966)-N(2))-methyltransferase RsmD
LAVGASTPCGSNDGKGGTGMRVISGKARGTKLFAPDDSKTIRPTSDYVRENLFNIIQQDVAEATFLDVFAGTGAVGIEALSRGAGSAVFIDNSQKAVELIKKNLEKTNLADFAVIIKGSMPETLKKLSGRKFDIIFLDPPYFEGGLPDKTLNEVLEQDILDENGIIVIEAPCREQIKYPGKLEVYKEKIYGSSKLIFLMKGDC